MADMQIPPADTKKPPRIQTSAIALLLLAVISGIIAISLAVRQPIVPPAANQATLDSAKPAKDTVTNYQVAPDLPKYISMPSIAISQIRIMQLGTSRSNQIASPANVFDAGWYNQSAKPGEAGAMFIYGHVSSWETNGAFHDVYKLKPGDLVTITRGDNQNIKYRVEKSTVYQASSVPMNEVLAPIDPNQQGLNLMTCAGRIIKGTNEFSERLVVYASRVDN